MKSLKLLLILSISTVITLSTDCSETNAPNGNLIKNGSFENPGESQDIAEFWDNGIYKAGVRTSEKASEGKYSVLFTGDGKNHLGLFQTLALDYEKFGNGKLKISCDVYVENHKAGVIKPIHFIIGADKVFYPGKALSINDQVFNRWTKMNFELDLNQYKDLKKIDFYIIG